MCSCGGKVEVLTIGGGSLAFEGGGGLRRSGALVVVGSLNVAWRSGGKFLLVLSQPWNSTFSIMLYSSGLTASYIPWAARSLPVLSPCSSPISSSEDSSGVSDPVSGVSFGTGSFYKDSLVELPF